MSESEEQNQSLIPPARFGALLMARRRELNVDLSEMAKRSNGNFRAIDLERIEKGQVSLGDAVAAAVMRLYEMDAGPLVPERSELVLDLANAKIGVGTSRVSVDTSTTDAVLERYVSLLYLLRNETPGKQLTLRDRDLEVLGSGLKRKEDWLRTELNTVMESKATPERTRRLSMKTIVSAAGVLVGATAMGSLIIVSNGGGASEQLVKPTPGKATLITNTVASTASNTVSGTLISTSGDELAAPITVLSNDTAEVQDEIGTALTVTANGDSVEAAEQVGVEDVFQAIGTDYRELLPGWSFSVEDGDAAYGGMTNSTDKTIVVYARPGDSAKYLGEVMMHEIGHAIDLEFMDDDIRYEWIEMRQIPAVWWAESGQSDFSVGSGDFAEAVAAATTGSRSDSAFGAFSAEQLQFVSDMIAALG